MLVNHQQATSLPSIAVDPVAEQIEAPHTFSAVTVTVYAVFGSVE